MERLHQSQWQAETLPRSLDGHLKLVLNVELLSLTSCGIHLMAITYEMLHVSLILSLRTKYLKLQSHITWPSELTNTKRLPHIRCKFRWKRSCSNESPISSKGFRQIFHFIKLIFVAACGTHDVIDWVDFCRLCIIHKLKENILVVFLDSNCHGAISDDRWHGPASLWRRPW